ncbi:uncharacterized protein [Panulirus ornatus]|uniref:uncharacterized protein n=1 Tax=Panulirus ornatus TaxID=150431 RepID=UPI003A8B1538
MTKIDCLWRGGTGSDLCAQAFGVCCVIVATENGESSSNNTLIYRAAFNAGVDLTYTIGRMNNHICQYRLDVKTLNLYQVESDGSCLFDWMTVSQDTKFQKVCGITENVHYYIDVEDSATFTFHTDASQSYDRSWEIYVQQLTCDETGTAAPEGCGQWYWGTSGKIDIWSNVDPGQQNWYYLDGQNYAVCVRWEAGYCSITYSETNIFQPRCNDLFERPGQTSLQAACVNSPPSGALTYTLDEGKQHFYIQFLDTTNQHTGSISNPYKNPSITYTQNPCI